MASPYLNYCIRAWFAVAWRMYWCRQRGRDGITVAWFRGKELTSSEDRESSREDPRVARRSLFRDVVYVIGAAIAAFCVLEILGWYFLVRPNIGASSSKPIDLLEMSKLVLTVVAGLGGGVAIVVAFRRQRVQEAAHELTAAAHELAREAHSRDDLRILNERFVSSAKLLGDKESPAIRMAGVHAIASLADDWADERQMCIDVLCAYLKLPYDPESSPAGEREVRFVVLSVIASRLTEKPDVSWHGCRFDLRTATFDGGDMSGMTLAESTLDFTGATFCGNGINLSETKLEGGSLVFSNVIVRGAMNFEGLKMSSGLISFHGANFSEGQASFSGALLMRSSRLDFTNVKLKSGAIDFSRLRIGVDGRFDSDGSNPEILFESANLHGGSVSFEYGETFDARSPDKDLPTFSQVLEGRHDAPSVISFRQASVAGSVVSFRSFVLPVGLVDFCSVEINAGQLDFREALLCGGKISFDGALLKDSGVVTFKYAVLADSKGSRKKALEVPRWLHEVDSMSPEDRLRYNARDLAIPNGVLSFWDSKIEGGVLDFEDAEFRSGTIHFVGTRFAGGETRLGCVDGNVVLHLWLSRGLDGDFFSMEIGSYAFVLVHRPYGRPAYQFPSGILSYEISPSD